jgi:hypothetical protein
MHTKDFRPETGRVLVDGIPEGPSGLTRPLVRTPLLFGGWGPRLW